MDDKFDEMMEALQDKKPSEFQIQKWKKAVRQTHGEPTKLGETPSRSFYWSQMVAAALIGVVIGGLLFGDLKKNEKNHEIAYEDATIEVVYTKL